MDMAVLFSRNSTIYFLYCSGEIKRKVQFYHYNLAYVEVPVVLNMYFVNLCQFLIL